MKLNFADKRELVEYVEDMLLSSAFGWPLTMTIRPEPLEGFSATIVTGELSDDIEKEQVASFFSQTQVNT